LGELLFTHSTSPFKKYFIEKGLAGNYAPACGFNIIGNHGIFSIGFSGVKNSQLFIDKLFEKITNVLYDI